MGRAKASDVLIVKQFICQKSPDAEKVFLEQLSAEADTIYKTVAATSWMPIEAGFEIYAKAAAFLYPQDPKPARRLGYEVNRIQLKGIYKVFIRFASIEYIIKRVSQMWNTYYDAGEACLENFGETGGNLVVKKFPELAATQREYVAGFIQGILEMSGVANVQVQLQNQDPMAWRWFITFLKK
jgi:hypothetical protein